MTPPRAVPPPSPYGNRDTRLADRHEWALPFTIVTLRGFLGAILVDLEETALVDGCTRAQAFRRIVFPCWRQG
ncbi:MAG: hypothetical protein ABIQ18_32690 [Umezawaea sp.]